MLSKHYIVSDIRAEIASGDTPAIVRWNRLEGRPRTHTFDRALQAEVRDALWFLARQWQMGEFIGDDAASPIDARVALHRSELTAYLPHEGALQPFDLSQPLEARVERRPLPLEGGQPGTPGISLDLRLMAGRMWKKLLQRAWAAGDLSRDYRPDYDLLYPIAIPDPEQATDADICAHPSEWALREAVAGRVCDGVALLLQLNSQPASTGISPAVPADLAALDALGSELQAWQQRQFLLPEDGEKAWQPAHLEYQFGVSAPREGGEMVLRAQEYYQGHLDWYSLDVDVAATSLASPPLPAPPVEQREVISFIPTPIAFEGMPHTRWWAFEEGKTNFGQLRPDSTDLGKLLLMEFALVYANDWFIFPYTLPVGSVARVEGIAVTDVFGDRTWVTPVAEKGKSQWQAWNMFTLNKLGQLHERADSSLVLLPAVPKVLEGKPLEEVMLVRDEMANMVWGIERRVPAPSGKGRSGAEMAQAYLNKRLELAGGLPVTPLPKVADWRYEAMNTLPEHWIPFIPGQLENSQREVALQRASMPRILPGLPIEKVKPRTPLLREGLAEGQSYGIHEEEVPRAGVVVKAQYQRTRWLGGQVFTWYGVRKQTGRGEASSQLAFDQLRPED